MYEGTPNEGMRGIKQIIEEFIVDTHLPVHYEIFDIRMKAEIPGTDFDVYISTGGPGSPLESENALWERRYFGLMESIKSFNQEHPRKKKHVFLICHSFQVFCRYYGFGLISKRKSTSFGVMPGHKTDAGFHDPLLRALNDPFWVADSRDYQLTQPNIKKIESGGGSVLCIEKIRPHVNLERAVMAIRFDEAFFGTQFHPEADAAGMRMHLLRDDKKELVIEKYGEKKYWDMLEHLNDPDKIMLTYNTIIPRFLMIALQHRFSPVSL